MNFHTPGAQEKGIFENWNWKSEINSTPMLLGQNRTDVMRSALLKSKWKASETLLSLSN
jgi:hypothetical protein